MLGDISRQLSELEEIHREIAEKQRMLDELQECFVATGNKISEWRAIIASKDATPEAKRACAEAIAIQTNDPECTYSVQIPRLIRQYKRELESLHKRESILKADIRLLEKTKDATFWSQTRGRPDGAGPGDGHEPPDPATGSPPATPSAR